MNSHELDILNTQGYYLLYDCKNKVDGNLLNWNSKKLVLDEEKELSSLQTYINQLIGYVCSCKFTSFQKIKIKKTKNIDAINLDNNPIEFMCIYVVESEVNAQFTIGSEIIQVESNMLIILKTSLFNVLTINTKDIKILTVSVHQYAT